MANFLFVLAVFGLFGLAYLRPGVAVGFTLSGFAVEQCAQAFVPIAGANNALMNYVFALAVVVAVTRQLVQHGIGTLLPRGPTWPPLLLLSYCYLTIVWSLFPSATERSLRESLPYLVVFVGLAPLTVQSAKDLSDAYLSLILATTAAFIPLLLFAEWRGRSVYLPYGDFNSNPLALTQAAGASLICAALSPVLRRLPGPLPLLTGGVTMITVLFAFLRSGSRGQIVSSIGTSLVFVAATRRGLWVLPVILAGLGLLGSGLLEEEVRPNQLRWSEHQLQHDLTEDRVAASQQLFDYWSSSDLFHQLFGLGNFTATDPRILGGYPHVVPLEVLCEEGVVGALLLLSAIFVTVRYLLKAIRTSSGDIRDLFTTAFALTVYEFLLTLKQGTLTGNKTFLTLLVLPSGFLTLLRSSTHQHLSSLKDSKDFADVPKHSSQVPSDEPTRERAWR